MQNSEIELKFPVDDPAELQARLPGLGFHLDTPRTFEQNTLYDTPVRTLRESRQILRLRRYGALWTLTHKRAPAVTDESSTTRYKIRVETEAHVDDGPALGQIFEQLGFGPVFRYEKFRTEWSHAALADPGEGAADAQPLGHLVIDETPIGVYAELEGPMGWIDETLAILGVNASTCITESYGKLFLAWKQRTHSEAMNLTFDEIPSPFSREPAFR
jgi:adenylate cyclase class 2